ncbi:MAG: hypothetical protein COB40_11805 [Marinosulfonomonas sp.]|nr:MAG: hypothetical protein COB40_11805 [Marinosulfonomonas sp.]
MKRSIWKIALGIFAILFGTLTIVSGGKVLLGNLAAVQAAGDVVNFVLWFNFLSGPIYILAGVAIAFGKQWAKPLAAVLAVSIVTVFALFAWHISSGGAYETRTLGAMVLRSGFWVVAALALFRAKPARLAGA